MFCSVCGTHNEDGSSICVFCGAKLRPEEPEAVAYQAPVEEKPTTVPCKALGTVSLILGIVSLVTCCIGIDFAIPGIILASIAKGKARSVGMTNKAANIGLILSILGIVVCIIAWIAYFVMLGIGEASLAGSGYGDYYYY